MTIEEMRKAKENNLPVICQLHALDPAIEYTCISEIVQKGNICTAILKDKCGRSVTYAAPECLRLRV